MVDAAQFEVELGERVDAGITRHEEKPKKKQRGSSSVVGLVMPVRPTIAAFFFD